MNFGTTHGNVMPITGIQFSILGESEIRRMSVINGFLPTELYDIQMHQWGLLTQRFGDRHRDPFCMKCGLDLDNGVCIVRCTTNNGKRIIG